MTNTGAHTYRRDQGIGSLGWAIIDANGNVVDRVAGSETNARLAASNRDR